MKYIFVWMIGLALQSWIRMKFFFRDIALRFERMVYLARLFKLIKDRKFKNEDFARIIPCMFRTPETARRWTRELRDVMLYLGHCFDPRMAEHIVRKCQDMFHAHFLKSRSINAKDVCALKRGLYKLAGQIKSIMPPIAISESANFLLSRMYAVLCRIVVGAWEVEEE